MMDITWPSTWDALAVIYMYFIAAYLGYRLMFKWPIQKIKQLLGL